nr:hypothetical protein [Hydrotalea flava]
MSRLTSITADYQCVRLKWCQTQEKLARYTWPLWLYVAVTGPIVYLFISPYYQ